MSRTIFFGFLATVVLARPAPARMVESWPYDRLLAKADVVVIATALSSANSGDTMSDDRWDVNFIGVNTTFQVKAVLKGKVQGGKLRVLHYRLKLKSEAVINGPGVVSFRVQKKEAVRPDYLLFLKAQKDGRYEAVSGQIDPDLSVREISRPLDAE